MSRIPIGLCFCVAILLFSTIRPIQADSTESAAVPAIGVQGTVGCGSDPTVVDLLRIKKPGTYENYLVDGNWRRGNLVKITSNDVILRRCEIRHGQGNGVFVSKTDVLIDSCRIHHMLAGTFHNQDDAHGITGNPKNLTIRNCEIYYVSGDALQFDPDRNPWGRVTIENCTLWTGPLPERAARFWPGERPGENALDTKQSHKNPRSKVIIRNCLFHGWTTGQINTPAALNIKENVEVTIENCVFRNNSHCFRLRGSKANAEIMVKGCAVYDSKIAFRIEDNLRGLIIQDLGTVRK